MKYLKNETGGALLYIVMLFLIFLMFSPLILQASSHLFTNSMKIKNQRLANSITVGAMESLITYLMEYDGGMEREAYFTAYPGWGEYEYELPDSRRVKYQFTHEGPGAQTNQRLVAMMQTTVGTGPNKAEDTLIYTFNSSASSGNGDDGGNNGGNNGGGDGNPSFTVDPDERVCVPEFTNMVYLNGDRFGGSINDQMKEYVDVDDVSDLNIANLMDPLFTHYLYQYPQEQLSFHPNFSEPIIDAASAPTCSELNGGPCSFDDISTVLAANPHLAVLRIDSNIMQNSAPAWQWGSPERPVQLIFQDLTFNFMPQFTLYGDMMVHNLTLNHGWNANISGSLQVNGNLNYHGSSNSLVVNNLYINNHFTANTDLQVNNEMVVNGNITFNGRRNWEMGKVYSAGSFMTNNGGTLHVDDFLIAAGDIILHNGVDAKAGHIVSGGQLTSNNGLQLSVDWDVLVRSLTLNATNEIVTGGDVLVQNHVTVNNHIDLLAGGSIVFGGTTTFHNFAILQNGGGSSSFLIAGEGKCGPGSGGNDDGSDVGWGPIRES